MAPIPKSAPFEDDQIEILNRVVGPASAVQLAWLAGFLAGSQQQAGVAPEAAAPPRPLEPLTILYATESGNSEKLAADAAKAARKLGFKPALVDMADFDVAGLAKIKKLIVVAATWGEGEAPARAAATYAQLMGDEAPRADGLEFAVLALGDTAYVEFCAIGRAIDERLAALGGKRIADRVDCDLDFEAPAADWIGKALKTLAPATIAPSKVIEVDFSAKGQPVADSGPFEAEVIEHIDLNSSRSDKETVHIELAFEGAVPDYKPGDSLDLFVENDPDLATQILAAAKLGTDNPLHAEFVSERDITTLSLKTLESFAAVTGNADARALIESGTAREWIVGRQLIDLLEAFPASLSADQLRALTRPLAPRAYSIASSRAEVGNEAHLLVSAVRYASHGRQRTGVASGYVAERLRKGQRVRAKLRRNKHFALPAADKDIIMVGPGTGVAPFRAFVQERRATAAPGRNWLFFGDRTFTHDFLYQLEWQDALKDGALHRMDVAFSRDTPEKTYVQDRIWQQRRDVVAWLDGGASFYVCGDAKAMAKDVRATLVRAYGDVNGLAAEAAEQSVRQLERGGRYLQDVY